MSGGYGLQLSPLLYFDYVAHCDEYYVRSDLEAV